MQDALPSGKQGCHEFMGHLFGVYFITDSREKELARVDCEAASRVPDPAQLRGRQVRDGSR